MTTCSPARTPEVITESLPTTRDTVTLRKSAVRSGLTTKTYCPFCPVCTAALGISTAFLSVLSVRLTSANCPGHSRRSRLANVAFSLIMPVAGSTVLSMKVSMPSAGLGSFRL